MTPDSPTIDVQDLDGVELLLALYERARPGSAYSMGWLQFQLGPIKLEEARAALEPGYVDYLYGRCLKVRLQNGVLDPRLYDREYGEGAAAEIVSGLRARPAR